MPFSTCVSTTHVATRVTTTKAVARRLITMRILVALEDEYRIYREMTAAAILILRPRVEVETTGLDALEEQIARFDPQVVICSWPNTIDPGGRPTLVELSLDPTQPTKVWVSGRYSELSSPALEALLGVIEETERELIQTKGERI
jgi:hypothetical protein